MKNHVQLVTYVDRLSAGGIARLQALLEGPLAGLFGGVHLLPFFHPIDGADAGFDPIDHARVDPRLGGWDDVRRLAAGVDLMADVIVNHVSARSPQFADFTRRGAASPHAALFLTFGRVFPQGATEADLLRIYTPRPSLPFTTVPFADGSARLLWTSFTPEQIDIDVTHPSGQAYLDHVLETFARAGISMVRLDAIGYAIKRPGSSCFMLPETFDFIGEVTRRARALGMEVLIETHAHFQRQLEIAGRVDRVYDFALPPLVLDALFRSDARALKEWLAIAPRNAVTVLDTHDGIGVADAGSVESSAPGLLSPDVIAALVEEIHERSGGSSRLASGAAASNIDFHQVNCTFYDALGRDDRAYLAARAIQFFAPGVPQVYYVGLLAGSNDLDLLRRTGVGRDVNRRYYSPDEVEDALARPVVQALCRLIRFRNAHPAFDGELLCPDAPDHVVALGWRKGPEFATLEVDLRARRTLIRASSPSGREEEWDL